MNREAVSRWTLERLPGRVLKFLSALGRYPEIRALLVVRGYTEAEHELGWSLLHRASHFQAAPGTPQAGADPAVTEAIATLDNWDEPNFATILAILRRFFPEVAKFVFEGLKPAQGAAAVLSVKTFLDRIQQLTDGKERAASRKQDHAALALLAKRGYPDSEWARLAGLVKTAEKGAKPDAEQVAAAEEQVAAGGVEAEPALDPAEEKTLLELHGWYEDWSTVAGNHITRKRYLIALGLASPRKAKKGQKGKTDKGEAGEPENGGK